MSSNIANVWDKVTLDCESLVWSSRKNTGWIFPYLDSGFISVMNKLSGFGPLNLLTIGWGTLSGKDEGHFQP